MGGKGKQTTGYRYYMGLHAGVCHGPVDALIEIRGGDTTIWSGSQNASGSITINAPNAYGGDTREGGVQGKLDVMMGEPTQGVNAYLQSVIGGLQNAYRGLLTLVFNGGQIAANNPYPKPWAFRVQRATAGWDNNNPWYTAKAQITLSNGAKGMNPAHIVYEVLTNRDWGMGYPPGIIDTVAFQAAADQLYTEGFGLCLLWLRTDTIESFLQLIMDYVGAVLVQSKTTGLFQFNLIRGGYNVGTLPVITRDDIIELTSLEAGSITGSTNEVVANWFDPTLKLARVTTVQALGAIQSQGVVVSTAKDYPGIASSDLAARVAQRDLRAVSVPLKRVKLKLDRSAYAFLPGGLFVLNFPDEQISSMVFRIGEVDYGTLTQGYISVTAIQDVFALPDTTYVVGQTTGWTVPDQTPTASPYNQAMEATYRALYLRMSASDLAG
ncbi:MAG TPA: phage tail protein, partial [Noviherbaspirillum sp.]